MFNKPKTVTAALIQARMASSRLPGKVLADISGKPMLHHVIDRVKASRVIQDIIVVTTTALEDQTVCTLADERNVKTYAGSAIDVLDRYYQAAKCFRIDVVVRITADCPLMDPSIIDRTVKTFFESGCDYASTAYPVATFPDGLDVEVFTFSTLERAWKEATLGSEREHVTPFIWKNPHWFTLKSVQSEVDRSDMRWTVDEKEDLEFVREVYRHLGTGTKFGMNDILIFLRQHPDVLHLNRGILRNEGYQKSLDEDRSVIAKNKRDVRDGGLDV